MSQDNKNTKPTKHTNNALNSALYDSGFLHHGGNGLNFNDNTLLESGEIQDEKGRFLGDIIPVSPLSIEGDSLLPYDEPLECLISPESPRFSGITFEERVHPLFCLKVNSNSTGLKNPDFEADYFENENISNNQIEEGIPTEPIKDSNISEDNKTSLKSNVLEVNGHQSKISGKIDKLEGFEASKQDKINVQNNHEEQSNGYKISSAITHGSSKDDGGIDLFKRKDVVNKTVLRSAKRYFTEKFDIFMNKKKADKKQKKDFWKVYIKEFTESILNTKLKRINKYPGAKHEDIQALMAAMVIPHRVRRSDKTTLYYEISEAFTALLYRYTLNRLNSFLKQPFVGFVFKFYFEDGPFQVLLNEDETLSKHKELYIEASQELLEILSNPEKSIMKTKK